MKAGTLIFVLAGLAVTLAIAYLILRPRVTSAAGDSRPWYERGLDAIVPDNASLGFEGFGVKLGF